MINELVVNNLKKLNLSITTMESCTSGALISTITNVEGASDITEGAYVTYSNQAKIDAGVSKDIINNYGVYSYQTAVEMAYCCKKLKKSSIGIGITGTFNNVDANNKDSKQGIVYFAIDFCNNEIFHEKIDVPIMHRSLQKQYVVNKILEYLNCKLIKIIP